MDNDSQSTKKTTRRGIAYPSIDLDAAIEKVKLIRDNLGSGTFSRESAAKALGYKGISGISSSVIGALVHYGLLERKIDVYKLAPLTDEIFVYRDEDERTAAIRRAALQPKLYSQLMDAYGGRSLPGMLDHILVRDYRISESGSGSAAKTFQKTMESAGLLENGILMNPDLPPRGKSADHPNDGEVGPTTPDQVVDEPAFKAPPKKRDELNRMVITDGMELVFDASITLDLMTNQKFTTAVADLKKALDASSEGDGDEPA